jgi:hypothetical protein
MSSINPALWFWVLAIISFMIIATQTINSWYVFDHFSRIENKNLKRFQSIMFCSIISLFILTMVFIGEHKMALAGAIFETILNYYYYAQDFWDKGFKQQKQHTKRKAIGTFWRKYWFKIIFLGTGIPAIIYICSFYMLKMRMI